MLAEVGGWLIDRIFGGGFQAELADRGFRWLGRESRKALDHEPEHLTTVRLTPGESYTVVARPRPTAQERRLAARVKALTAADTRMSRPTRRQLRAARKLRRAQRRLDGRRPGTRRRARAAAREEALGRRFDTLTAPSKKLRRVRFERRVAERELEMAREASFQRARRGRGRTSPPRSKVYD